MRDCVFCEIASGTERAAFVERWESGFAIRPIAPVTEGHILVIPTAHVADFTEDPEVTELVMYYAAELADYLGGDFNLITSKGAAATQTVFHLHVHLVPRRPGDGLTLPWTRQDGSDR